MKELEKARMEQARASLDEAKALLAGGMDTGFVLTSLYYAFFYPVLALMDEGRVPATMQSVTLGLFDRQFIGTGTLKQEYSDAMHRAFDSRPKCSGERTAVSRDEMRSLLVLAQEFINEVETRFGCAGKSKDPEDRRSQ